MLKNWKIIQEQNQSEKTTSIDLTTKPSDDEINVKETNDEESNLGKRDLRLDDIGFDVVELCCCLCRLGLLDSSYDQNSFFDEKVEVAVKRLQEEENLPCTGIFDQTTYQALKNRMRK